MGYNLCFYTATQPHEAAPKRELCENTMHQLLIRQLQQHLGQGNVPDGPLQPLMEAVGRHYATIDQAQLLLRGVMDASLDLICFKSASGVYQGCNAAFAAHLGLSEATLVGKSDFDIAIEETASAINALDEQALHLAPGEQHFSERWSTDVHSNQVCIETLRTPYFDVAGRLLGLISLGRDVTERRLAAQILQRHANIDGLTELPNRRFFAERLTHELKLAQRSKLSLALLVIGLDKFKEVNELLGHDVGDALLVQVAHRIEEVVRETDVAARLGGDEFVVVTPNLQDITDVERIAQNLIRRLAEPFSVHGETVNISASVGIALYPANAKEHDELLKNASQAMFFAKSSGRNRFSHFTFALQEAAAHRVRLTRDLRRAMEVKQFEVYYQPIIELRTGLVRKAEALLRWNHDGRGQIMPKEFVPLAEDNGAIIEISDWVFREAAQQVKALRASFHPDFGISINASPVQFRSSKASPASWFSVLAELGLPGHSVTLELTEGVLLKAEEFGSAKLKAFRDAGFQVSIDDFGTGYSSLSHLKRFDVDFLKIDHSFVRDLETDPGDKVLCEAIIVMAHKLGLKVVAEGVETPAQLAFLNAAGCDYAQGFLFAEPVPGSALLRTLEQFR